MQKKALCVTFLYAKTMQFALIFTYKIQTQCVTSLDVKTCTLRYVLYTKAGHYALYFYMPKKTLHFALLFISKMYPIVLIFKYKRTYNKSNQIEK